MKLYYTQYENTLLASFYNVPRYSAGPAETYYIYQHILSVEKAVTL